MKSKQRGEITTIMLIVMAGMLIWTFSNKHTHMGPMGMMNHADHAAEPASPPASTPDVLASEKSASATAHH
ncbi:MAG: hypothetical protein AB3X41_02080 [Leptothrix ochracea]|uniref:hypothetical protein n=1 Tax=Leptothrix ochracea TaxID=735331 RepID=UPI0034E2C712